MYIPCTVLSISPCQSMQFCHLRHILWYYLRLYSDSDNDSDSDNNENNDNDCDRSDNDNDNDNDNDTYLGVLLCSECHSYLVLTSSLMIDAAMIVIMIMIVAVIGIGILMIIIVIIIVIIVIMMIMMTMMIVIPVSYTLVYDIELRQRSTVLMDGIVS